MGGSRDIQAHWREYLFDNILNRVIIVNLKFIQISLNEFVIN